MSTPVGYGALRSVTLGALEVTTPIVRASFMRRTSMTRFHITMPLSTDGSAINNVVREVTRQASDAGINSAVVGSHRREYHFPHARPVEVDYTDLSQTRILATS